MTGLYFLLDRRSVLYIGKSFSVTRRIADHTDKKFTNVRLIECDKAKLNHYEGRWIRKFKPPLNRMMVKSNKPLKHDFSDLKLGETRKFKGKAKKNPYPYAAYWNSRHDIKIGVLWDSKKIPYAKRIV